MFEERLKRLLQKTYYICRRAIENLSFKWREHTNRRTILILIIFGSFAVFLFQYIIRPPDNFPLNELVTIEEGSTLEAASAYLESAKVVRSTDAFRIIVTLMGKEKEVHAGDYLFKEPQTIFAVSRAISIGAYGLEPTRIRVPEGATTKEMAALFDIPLLRFDAEEFQEAAKLEEGFLFPDTYFFLPNATDELVIRTMRQNFDTQIATISDKIDLFGKPLRDVVIMASLLEREARNTRDRRMIAGVLWNRLEKGMLLQVDAAFLYTLGKGTYELSTADLESDSPYNTYRYKGLPAGPIGSPSMDSLIAAVTPIDHDYLYYLADKKGVTYYSKSYAEHLRKKNLYIN
ncbi:MAG TPA: endolytic transglycosylase MltG [Candidatus Paceibacterota bacterium]